MENPASKWGRRKSILHTLVVVNSNKVAFSSHVGWILTHLTFANKAIRASLQTRQVPWDDHIVRIGLTTWEVKKSPNICISMKLCWIQAIFLNFNCAISPHALVTTIILCAQDCVTLLWSSSDREYTSTVGEVAHCPQLLLVCSMNWESHVTQEVLEEMQAVVTLKKSMHAK